MEKIKMVKDSYKGTVLSSSLVESIEALPDGQYSIYIIRRGEIVSTKQIRLFWMWMNCLEDWSGQSKMDWHNHYCAKFLSPIQSGISGLNKVAMTRFMTQIQVDALTEWGVNLPLPEDQDIETYNEFIFEHRYK